MSDKPKGENLSQAMDELDEFLNDVSREGDELIDPRTIPFSSDASTDGRIRQLNRTEAGTGARSACSGPHRGQKLKGVPSLMGSSLRDGLEVPGDSVTVILARDALQMAFPAGWASYRSPEFNSHLRGALVFWPWKDYDAPTDLEQSARRVLELHEIHRSGKTVEVACHGGHGRTGTLLAILAALHEGWRSEEAVGKLRKAYCERAVECKAQETFVYEVVRKVREMLNKGKEVAP